MKKNNIGIMTFHDAINYGAALQTYALNKYINNLNYNCETIDYKCDYIENSYKILNINIKDIKGTANSILNVRNNVIRKNKFNKFLKNNVKISQLKYNSNNIWQSNSKYNTFIVGSDQVWNIDLCADFNYFLPFVNSKNERVSFAASFGDINIINRNGKIIKKELEKYNCKMSSLLQLQVAVEELFVNICNYAYVPNVGKVKMQIDIVKVPLTAVIKLIDNGKKYNPLEKSDPDITKSAEEREIGGLGILLAKKNVDVIKYEYSDGKNIVTLKKKMI